MSRVTTRFRKPLAGSYFRVGRYGSQGRGTIIEYAHEKFCVIYASTPTWVTPPANSTLPNAPHGPMPMTGPAYVMCTHIEGFDPTLIPPPPPFGPM